MKEKTKTPLDTEENNKASEAAALKKNQEKKKKIGPNLDFAATEAFNLLRTNIMFSFAQSQASKVVGVTSSTPSEGKSFIAMNLAYSMAEAGYKVILIDCDLRRPTVYKNLDLPLSPGLSNLLVNEQRNVVHNGVVHENLSVITAGDIPPNPSELLGSERMRNALQLLTGKFDYVLLDLPPVLSVADPLVVSKFLDGIVVVIKHNHTRRNNVKEVIRQLKFTGVHILGFVYNSFGTGSSSGYYKSKYYRSKRYGYGYGKYYRRSQDSTSKDEKRADTSTSAE